MTDPAESFKYRGFRIRKSFTDQAFVAARGDVTRWAKTVTDAKAIVDTIMASIERRHGARIVEWPDRYFQHSKELAEVLNELWIWQLAKQGASSAK